MAESRRPTRAELLAAAGATIHDVIAPNLRVLFCGINPGLYSAVTGHHFARPGNRFWPALHAAGFTQRLLAPAEELHLLDLGYGITNLVPRSTATADELSADELRAGGRRLAALAEQFTPQAIAVLGVSAFRGAFQRPKAAVGPQQERLGAALLWVLPNPSGLNAHYTPADLARVFREFRLAVEGDSAGSQDRVQ